MYILKNYVTITELLTPQELRLTNNSITVIAADAFEENIQINSIYLDENHIRNAVLNLSSLKNLRLVDLSGNPLILVGRYYII